MLFCCATQSAFGWVMAVCLCKCVSAHGDVEDGDNVESGAEDGAHAFDRRLVQAIVGWQHLPVRDKWAHNKTVCCVTQGNPSAAACM